MTELKAIRKKKVLHVNQMLGLFSILLSDGLLSEVGNSAVTVYTNNRHIWLL